MSSRLAPVYMAMRDMKNLPCLKVNTHEVRLGSHGGVR